MTMTLFIQYKTTEDKVENLKSEVARICGQIKDLGDPEFEYTSTHDDDGVSFTHIAWFANEAAKDRFQAQAFFGELSAAVKGAAVSPPTVTKMHEVATSHG